MKKEKLSGKGSINRDLYGSRREREHYLNMEDEKRKEKIENSPDSSVAVTPFLLLQLGNDKPATMEERSTAGG